MVFNYVIVIYVFSYPEGYPDYYERGERRARWWWWWGCVSSLRYRTTKKTSKKRPSRVTDGELKRRYRDPGQPGSLGGAARFAKAQGITVQRAKRILERELGYTLHKPTRRRFPTSRVLVFGPDEQWAADLVDVQKLKRDNKGTNYLLTVVDVFSKYAWVLPVKQKSGPLMAQALATLFKTSKRSP